MKPHGDSLPPSSRKVMAPVWFRTRVRLYFSSLAAGLAIGLGSLLFLLAKAYLSGFGLLVGAILFPIGLIIICLGSLHLYTGKIGLVLRPTTDTSHLHRLEWLFIILIGNCAGALLVGLLIYGFTFIDLNSAFADAVKAAGEAKDITDLSFLSLCDTFLRGFFCGICVYLAVRFYAKARHMALKLLGVFVPIMLFVFFGFHHCIANVTYLSAAGLYSGTSFLSFLLSVLGNSLGALLLDRLID